LFLNFEQNEFRVLYEIVLMKIKSVLKKKMLNINTSAGTIIISMSRIRMIITGGGQRKKRPKIAK